MYLKKIIPIILAFFAITLTANAQVTTSSIAGVVKDTEAKALVGATITANYQPTNSTFTTTSKAGGRFNISNLRSGGPYTVTISYSGHTAETFNDVYLQLGEATVLEPKLVNSKNLDAVIVTGTVAKNAIINSNRTGASTNVGRAEIQRLPTISRSLNEITKLTPQSNGNAVGGGNSRQNNVTVDGADFNNNFGIGSNLPAGGSPISLDAIDQISVSLTPFDVRQSGFIGSSLNAVTRSGTNQFSGSVYKYFRSGNEQGTKVGNETAIRQSFNFQQYGVRFGGPIIKNKLFFFVSYETEDRPKVVQSRSAATTANPFSATNTGVARPTADSMNEIRNFLKTKYGYETGEYDNYSLKNGNTKILGRIDWNINKNHRFNVRYNQVEGGEPFAPSGSVTGLATGTGNALVPANTRNGQNAMWFRNSNYFQGANFYSFAAELNSTFGKFTNTLRGSYTNQDDSRTSESALFPFVDIMSNGTGLPGGTISAPGTQSIFTSFGYEPFTLGNLRKVKSYSFFDNITLALNKNLITAGIQADFNKTTNGFQRAAMSYYSFASWDDFKTNQLPTNFALTYSLSPGFAQAFPSFKFAQYSAFIQDEISTSDRFKLTLGLRADLPTYPGVDEIKTHPLVATMNFANGEKINTGALPKQRIMLSPRAGFNWDVYGNRSLQVRGGAGIFTGKVPFVWIVSQSGDAGLLQVSQTFTGASIPGVFNPNPAAYLPSTVPAPGTVVPSFVTATATNFRFPQSFKASLAFDKKLAKGLILTMEGIFNRDLYTAIFDNPNLVAPTPLGYPGYNDNRLIYPAANNVKYINTLNAAGLPTAGGPNAFNAYVLKNGKGGYYGSFTTKVEKLFSKGFAASVAYTNSLAANRFDGGGDQPAGAWQGTANVNGANGTPISSANYVVPHRVLATLSYAKEYLKHFKTTVSLLYDGSSQGRYSYIYSQDLNRDGNFNDLIYIPKDASELLPYITANKTFAGGVVLTPQQQVDAFFAYVDQDKYLSKHKGQYAERNEGLFAFRSQLDFKLLQDVFVNVGKKRNTIQFSLDIFNFGNLLNKNWGAVKTLSVSNGAILVPTNAALLVAGSTTVKPTFQLNSDIAGGVPSTTYRTVNTVSSTYFMQFGLRYIFN
jgi:Carboxypeptidase regulatory-like domain